MSSGASSAAPVAASPEDLLLFWYDMYEPEGRPADNNMPADSNAGHVYIFGKLISRSAYESLVASTPKDGRIDPSSLVTTSCCVVVKDVQRTVHFLPRPHQVTDPADPSTVTDTPVKILDVYNEVRALLQSRGITNLQTKTESRRFCFDWPGAHTAAGVAAAANAAVSSDSIAALSALAQSGAVNGEAGAHMPFGSGNEAEYLKVLYSSQFAPLPRSTSGHTFSHVLGTNASKTELVTVGQKLIGPGWISIKGAKQVPWGEMISWCSIEFEVGHQLAISPFVSAPGVPTLPEPLFSSASLSLKTELVEAGGKGGHKAQEVIAATVAFYDDISVDGKSASESPVSTQTWLVKPRASDWPEGVPAALAARKAGETTLVNNEMALFSQLLRKIELKNPDIIVQHGLHGSGMDTIINAAQRLNLGLQWSKIGRLKKYRPPRSSNRSAVEMGAGAGRLLVDTDVSAREFSPSKLYTLPHLAAELLNVSLTEVSPVTVGGAFARADTIADLVRINVADALAQHALAFHLELVPLTFQLTQTCGNTWGRTVRSLRAERVEFLLLHEFTRSGFLPPEKLTRQEQHQRKLMEAALPVDEDNNPLAVDVDTLAAAAAQAAEEAAGKGGKGRARGKPQYKGGYVIEPVAGLYSQWVAVLDFNSLYPSIIREYNLCFSTRAVWNASRAGADETDTVDPETAADDGEASATALSSSKAETGILPRVVARLIERRRAVKDLLKTARSAGEKSSLNIRQLALKLVANSMYGCLGFPSSRFFYQPLAATVTSRGRNALATAVSVARTNGGDIIYGDTDSIMIDTKADSIQVARQLAGKIKVAINKRFKLLTMDLDAMYMSLLLLKKKKYAALKLSGEALASGEALQQHQKYAEAEANYFAFIEAADKAATASQDNPSPTPTKSIVDAPAGLSLVYRAEPLQSKEGESPQRVLMLKRTMKGIDAVRRDWAPVSRAASMRTLDVILAGRDVEDTTGALARFFSALNFTVRSGMLGLDPFVMTKSLTKAPTDYENASANPHVVVALRMINEGKLVRVGDVIEYVVVAGTGSYQTRCIGRAEYAESLAAAAAGGPPVPPLDFAYYVEQQIFPPISRLCDVIGGLDRSRIASLFGLDPEKYDKPADGGSRTAQSSNGDGLGKKGTYIDPFARFGDCETLPFCCPTCGVVFPFLGAASFVPVNHESTVAALVADVSSSAPVAAPSPARVGSNGAPPALPMLGAASASDLAALPYTRALAATLKTVAAAQRHAGSACGLVCPTPGCEGVAAGPDAHARAVAGLCNTATKRMRRVLKEYHSSWLHVDNAPRTRDLFVAAGACNFPLTSLNSGVEKETTHSKAFLQAQFLSWLFDDEMAEVYVAREKEIRQKKEEESLRLLPLPADGGISPEQRAVLREVKAHVDKALSKFACYWIDLGAFFGWTKSRVSSG